MARTLPVFAVDSSPSAPKGSRGTNALTLLELLVVITIIGILVSLTMPLVTNVRNVMHRASCANSLRQLGAATQLYLSDHEQTYFAYVKKVPEGELWYFGLERSGRGAEGSRDLDREAAPLYRYVQEVGKVEVCAAFPYNTTLWKPKFKGASWGYGFNTSLSEVHARSVTRPSSVILFGDSAQVNNFQAPASAAKPMIEEFYMIERNFATIHFRHGSVANLLFADGHVNAMEPAPGTIDKRLPDANIGRITPRGSTKYLVSE